MSLYVRVIPCKSFAFINTKNQMIKFNRRLTKLIRISALNYEANFSLKRMTQNEIRFNPLTSITVRGIDFNVSNLNYYYSLITKLSEKTINDSENFNQSLNNNNKNTDEKSSGPTNEQLQYVYKTLEHDLPRFFVSTMNYRIYHKDLEFINHFKGVVTNGITDYLKQTMIIRVAGHLSFVYIKFDVLKITLHPEDNTIKVRWRIRGLSALKAIINFYKFRLATFSKDMGNLEKWYDGFSTFFVGPDGLIFKHIADKMMPDNDTVQDKSKSDYAAKLAA